MKRPQWKAPAAWLQLRAQLDSLRERYAALQPREQQILLAGGVIVLLALAYLAVWEPAVQARASAAQALTDARDQAVRIQRLAAAAPVRHAAPTGSGQSLLARVDQAAKRSALGVSPSRLQPDGDKRVRVWFDGVPFDAMVQWLHDLQQHDHVTVENADFSRKDTPGKVDVQLTLVRGS